MNDAPPTWNTVKRFFTGNDIAIMRSRGVILDDYDYMKRNARTVLRAIEAGGMPPEEFPQWTQEQKDTFRAWMNNLDGNGFPRRKDPNPSEDTKKFITLSEFLTGVDGLDDDPELAHTYYQRLWDAGGAPREGMPSETNPIPKVPDPEASGTLSQATVQAALRSLLDSPTAETLNADDNNRKVAKATILLWYTGSFINSAGFPDGDNGTPEKNQYPDGLVWRVAETHPMAYSTDGAVLTNGVVYVSNQYWSKKPDNGANTGLGTQQV